MESIHPSINAKTSCASGLLRCLPPLKSCYPACLRRKIHARKERKEARASNEVLMHLPYGFDRYGKEVLVEILQIGIKETFTQHELRAGKAAPVCIMHDKDGRKVTWGAGNTQYARFGKSYIHDVRVINKTINFDSDERIAPVLRTEPDLATTPAPDATLAAARALAATVTSTAASKADVAAAATAAALAVAQSVAAAASVPGAALLDILSSEPKGKMEGFINGSLFDPLGKMPNERAGFRIVSVEPVDGEAVVKTWWASTIWYSRKNKAKGNYVAVARHSLIAMEAALEEGVDLRVITDYSNTDVGVYGKDNRSDKTNKHAVLPKIDLTSAKCLADALPRKYVNAYYESLTLGLAPPDPAILYDFLLVPCTWDMSVAQLRAAPSNWGPALGKQVRIRAFDFYNPDRNGVTTGLIQDTPENRKRAFNFGFVESLVSNSYGGSSSIGYHDQKSVYIHLGKRNDNLNYGISGAAAQQLESYWCGRPPCDATDIGFKSFQTATKKNLSACEKVMNTYPPQLVGNKPTAAVVDMFVDSLLPPDSLLQMSTPEMPKQMGSKASNTMRHAIGRAKGAAGLKQLASQDYNKARAIVRSFKLATNASSATMAMLYYWIDGGSEEDYGWQYTTKEGEEMEADWGEVEEEYENWLLEAFWGEEHGPDCFAPFVRRGNTAVREEVDGSNSGDSPPVRGWFGFKRRSLPKDRIFADVKDVEKASAVESPSVSQNKLMYSHQPFADVPAAAPAPSVPAPALTPPVLISPRAVPVVFGPRTLEQNWDEPDSGPPLLVPSDNEAD